MTQSKNTSHEQFKEITGESLPNQLQDLPLEDVHALNLIIANALEKEENGYTRLFESLAVMMKYVPNFILHSMIPKYIEPNIAAKITGNLNTKQVAGVASGLSAAYIAEAATHMENQKAADVLHGLKRKLANQVLEHAINTSPILALDILIYAPEQLLKEASLHYQAQDISDGLNCSKRTDILKKIHSFT